MLTYSSRKKSSTDTSYNFASFRFVMRVVLPPLSARRTVAAASLAPLAAADMDSNLSSRSFLSLDPMSVADNEFLSVASFDAIIGHSSTSAAILGHSCIVQSTGPTLIASGHQRHQPTRDQRKAPGRGGEARITPRIAPRPRPLGTRRMRRALGGLRSPQPEDRRGSRQCVHAMSTAKAR